MEAREENEFNFTINGKFDSIEVSSLTATLINLNFLIQEMNQVAKTNKKVDLTIKTYKPGSFDIYLQLIADAILVGGSMGMFSGNNIESAKQVIDFTLSALNLKKFLGNSKPKEVITMSDDRVQITNNKGQITYINTLVYHAATENENIDKSTKQLFKSISPIDNATGITIKDNLGVEQFKVEKETTEFDSMIEDSPIINEEEIKSRDIRKNNAVLSVFGLTFDDHTKWQFFYEGNKIPVNIEDKAFIEKVLNRQVPILNGDRFKCNLTIHQRWNKIAQVFENKSYTINEVLSDPIPPEQQSEI
jgi:hypothetical protein